MSGDTPVGTPSSRPVTSRKLLRLIAARSTPEGARAATAASDGSSSGIHQSVGRPRAPRPTRSSADYRQRRRPLGGTGQHGPMDNVKLDGPVNILVTLGLTLPSV